MSRAATAPAGLASDLVVYSVEDAARLLGISRSKAYAAVRDGSLKTIDTGRRRVVPASAIEALLWTALANRPPFLPPRAGDVDLNRSEISGRLTKDAEPRETNDGRPFTTFRLAVRRGQKREALFIDVVAFGTVAGEVAALPKGAPVRVLGRLDQREWTAEDGSRRQVHQIVADEVQAIRADPVPARRSA